MKNVVAALLVLSVSFLILPESSAQAERYNRTESVAGEPVVEDNLTGLMWQGCAAGSSGTVCTSGGAAAMTWQAAVSYCENLDWGGHLDWYLPNVKELRSIVDDRRVSPAIDTVFRETPADNFWSSSSYAAEPSYAWRVTFASGRMGSVGKGNGSNVRCARSGP